ncbi:MAG TPA: class GN sortase [Candidatus Sulfomarinibacteraceae bacterium]|nr:class GN sortase [Candidatus Sulfomarinibacteraceae bacterium]
MRRRWPAAASVVLAVAAAVQVVQAVWIPAKAELAQVLLRRAWLRTGAGGERCRPWPWADTWPVARLLLPEQRVELIVLAGASGATMAFAPGHLDGSAPPGGDGVSVIAGHRDTHFAVLERLLPGERVLVETPAGRTHEYVVRSSGVVHEGDAEALGRAGPGSLVLVTCWPFRGVSPGGDQRYLVWATAVSSQPAAVSSPADLGTTNVACDCDLSTLNLEL